MPGRKKVLYIYTGGTLGMAESHPPGPLSPGQTARDVLPFLRGVEELADIKALNLMNVDSSDLTPASWEDIARVIVENRERFDGFVVLHGTDTMAYTAAALSYMLPGLDRPVVLTGSQRLLAHVRTDARLNLIHATHVAASDVTEVSICFAGNVYRGNRAHKSSIQSYVAFASPNYPPLVTFGVDEQRGAPPLDWQTPFSFEPGFCSNVAVVSLFPGCDPNLMGLLVQTGVQGVVVEGFGDGNIPAKGWPEAIRSARNQEVAVVIATQAPKGRIKPGRYHGSQMAREAGAGFSVDMTLEATVTKLMWLLHRFGATEALAALPTPLAGEVSAA